MIFEWLKRHSQRALLNQVSRYNPVECYPMDQVTRLEELMRHREVLHDKCETNKDTHHDRRRILIYPGSRYQSEDLQSAICFEERRPKGMKIVAVN